MKIVAIHDYGNCLNNVLNVNNCSYQAPYNINATIEILKQYKYFFIDDVNTKQDSLSEQVSQATLTVYHRVVFILYMFKGISWIHCWYSPSI
jgi:hypothetical protein